MASRISRATLHIPDMMCAGCEDTLARTLGALDGVRVESADFTAGQVRVTVDAARSEELLATMRDAAEKQGYAVESIECAACENGVQDPAPAPAPRAPDDSAPAGSPTPSDSPVPAGESEPAVGASTPASASPSAAAPAPKKHDFTAVGILVALVGLYLVADRLGILDAFNAFPTVGTERMGYAALFACGLLTSVHCIAMCGGINLAQSVAGEGAGQSTRPLVRASLYNAGRLCSYTLIGGLLGLLGQAVAITVQVRAAIGVAAGVLMVALGIGMLGRFSFLRALSPKLPAPLSRTLAAVARKGSFCVGLVNGFMPCGPLQAMQLYAIASGSFAAGTSSMFAFCLGTVPLMFAFSGVAGLLRTSGRRALMQASSVVVMALGVVLAGNSLSIAGVTSVSTSDLTSEESGYVASTLQGDGTQLVVTQLYEDGYDSIQVQAGVPVVWVIEAQASALNGCNNAIVVAEYGLEVTLAEGTNTIEFTPEEAGTYTFSCWMGMLHATIEVVE